MFEKRIGRRGKKNGRFQLDDEREAKTVVMLTAIKFAFSCGYLVRSAATLTAFAMSAPFGVVVVAGRLVVVVVVVVEVVVVEVVVVSALRFVQTAALC